MCQSTILSCRENDPCIIECSEANSCRQSTIVSDGATDVTVNCRDSGACAQVHLYCGTGDCYVGCWPGAEDVCYQMEASVYDHNSNSFQCDGDCPTPYTYFPAPFTGTPTFAPTHTPTDNPTTRQPTTDPTTDPTHHPIKSPTTNPTGIALFNHYCYTKSAIFFVKLYTNRISIECSKCISYRYTYRTSISITN